MGIIRKVHEPTSWCSAIVVTSKKSGEVRICTDLRNVNKAVKKPSFQIPSFEDITARINGAKHFSVLDCKAAFHQIPVDEGSQEMLTFAVPSGRYCWCRLPYRLISAPEVFQSILVETLQSMPNVVCFFDDILIAAQSIEEHNSTLTEVLKKIQDRGITLNRSKCVFLQSEVEFVGY